jgi:hypothetical protein
MRTIRSELGRPRAGMGVGGDQFGFLLILGAPEGIPHGRGDDAHGDDVLEGFIDVHVEFDDVLPA